jgi:molecular chaperone DnaK
MNRAIGIDLGTTFSASAIVGDQQHVVAIPNREGALSTPSVVLWHEGHFLVGQPALDLVYAVEGQERERLEKSLIRGVKRMIGTPPVGGLSSNGYRTDPVEVSSVILRKLADDASAYLGFPVKDIVITVPAHFVDYERSATRAAAEAAGLRVLQIINEPSAAALAYTHGQMGGQGNTALVFDLGGGTFDVTVLQFAEREACVLSTKGIEDLGGLRFTEKLAHLLRRTYEKEMQTPFPEDSSSSNRLFLIAESTKCRLSAVQEVPVYLEPKTGKSVHMTITRQQFEQQIRLLLFQLEETVRDALVSARKAPTDVQRVLLCGGSSRIPAVQAMLTQLFGRQPEAILDLDLSVAIGAAYQAAAYREDVAGLELLPDVERVVDCVSYAVGIKVKDRQGINDTKLIMLRPGDPLDTWSRPYGVRIRTRGSVAAFPPIQLYTGDTEALHESEYLGSITVALPPDTPDGAPAMIMMRQDRNGLIQIQINLNDQHVPAGLQRL